MTIQSVSSETLAAIAAAVRVATRTKGRIQQIRPQPSDTPLATTESSGFRQHIHIGGDSSASIAPDIMVAIVAAVEAIVPEQVGRSVRITQIRHSGSQSEPAWSQLGRLRMMLLKEVRRR